MKYFTHLLDILLEEPEGEALVQLDLLGVPLALQLAVVSQDLVDHRQHVAGALLRSVYMSLRCLSSLRYLWKVFVSKPAVADFLTNINSVPIVIEGVLPGSPVQQI